MFLVVLGVSGVLSVLSFSMLMVVAPVEFGVLVISILLVAD